MKLTGLKKKIAELYEHALSGNPIDYNALSDMIGTKIQIAIEMNRNVPNSIKSIIDKYNVATNFCDAYLKGKPEEYYAQISR